LVSQPGSELGTVGGAGDPAVRRPEFKMMLGAMRNYVPGLVDTVMIDGAGHWIQQEAPERLTDELVRFLAVHGQS
jgi:pimeloyl-ACP methyl ester carboxylesterase